MADDYLHHPSQNQVSLVVPPDHQKETKNGGRYAKNEKKHKTRPKSAPKRRHVTTLDYPSNEDEGVEYYSEEELRLGHRDDEEGCSSAISDQDSLRADDHKEATSKVN
jgi:hypothetical protein